MFGFYRLFLAFLVVLLHLYGLPKAGNYAVFSFFILSGFLMTTIMHDQYGFTLSGRLKFGINRVLRLYPMYLYSALISVVLILIVGGDLVGYNKKLYLPSGMESVISNLTMVYLDWIPHRVDPILSPATWAITIELFFYALICFGISKTKKRVLIWLLVSILYFLYAHYAKTATWRYAAIPAGSLPFAIGSYLYFVKQNLFDFLKKLKIDSPFLWLVLFIVNVILTLVFIQNSLLGEFFFYMNILIATILTCALLFNGFTFLSKKMDAFLGEYSYPFYLLHYQAGAIVTFLILRNSVAMSNAKHTSILAIPVLIALSSFGIYFIDRRINSMRDRVKRNPRLG